MTARQLLASLSSQELTEWRAYYALEPFGELVADQRHGMAQAGMANLHRDPKRRAEPYRPEDFIPWHASHRQSAKDGGELLADPEAQSRLIKSRIFGER